MTTSWKTRKTDGPPPIAMLLILLAGFALRMVNLGRQSLWYDETVSAFLARLPVTELVAHTARDIHPPGYYLLLHFWAAASGTSETALAWFSLLFGMLLIPLTFLLAKTLFNQNVARWSALLVAVSPYNIWYSQEVRMYTLGAACGVAATWFALRALTVSSPADRKFWAGYVLFAVMGLYALYYFSFLLLVINALFLIYTLQPTVNRPKLAELIAANLVTALLYLPWLPIAWRQATNPPVPPWRTPPALWNVALESWSALSWGQSVNPVDAWPLLLPAILLFGLGLFALAAKSRKKTIFLLAYTFGPLLLIYLLSFVTPLYHVRYVFTYAPAFYIVLGGGLAWLATRRRWVAVAAAALWLAASGYSLLQYFTAPQYRPDDFRGAVQFIDNHWQPGDALLANAGYTYTAGDVYTNIPGLAIRRLVPYPDSAAPDAPLLLQTGTVNGSPQLGWGDPRADFYAMPAGQTIAALEQLAAEHPRLWMLRAYDTVTDPEGLIRNWLAQNAIPIEDQPFAGQSNIRVQGFLFPTRPPPGDAVHFEDGMVLAAWRMPNQTWQAGQTIPLKFWWQADAPPGADYKMSLKLWTPDGQLAAQGNDDWPGGSLFRPGRWAAGQVVYQPASLALPADLPPGQYWLNVELYHPDTVQPLPRLDDGSAAVTLGPVQIVP
ncbi:MAG: hypothetical protein D6768_05365 [Chloroflexi bacterium]|nr:MAG: hypothetical protein D6768_05365 [Chloroflexota bacterium]